jgi:hypothetical protein
MSFEHRNAVVGILVSFISWGLMIAVLGQNTTAGLYDGPTGPQDWARAVLWLIAISIAIAIAMTVLFNIGYAALTGEKDFSTAKDERDRIIALRAMQVAQIIMGAGIVLAIVYLALGGGLVAFLNAILAVCAISSLGSEVTKLVLYRRGL